jgi:predicted outer membrane protein
MRSGALAVAILVSAAPGFAQSGTGSGSGSGSGSGGSGGAQTGGDQSGSQGAQSGRASRNEETQFVEQMLIANMAEIQLGQMGSERASSAEVKSYAQMMVADHSKANQALMPLAQSLGVQQPTELDEKHRRMAERLSKLEGERFDREFMRAMVDAHKDVVKQTRVMAREARGSSGASGSSAGEGSSASATGTAGATAGATAGQTAGTSGSMAAVTSVPEYAAMTLPIVQQHLQHAEHLQQSVAK